MEISEIKDTFPKLKRESIEKMPYGQTFLVDSSDVYMKVGNCGANQAVCLRDGSVSLFSNDIEYPLVKTILQYGKIYNI